MSQAYWYSQTTFFWVISMVWLILLHPNVEQAAAVSLQHHVEGTTCYEPAVEGRGSGTHFHYSYIDLQEQIRESLG